MVDRWLRVQVLVPQWGGISQRPFVPDRAHRARFPPLIRLRATLLGLRMGELEVADAGGAGTVQALTLRYRWMRERVAARLFGGLLELAPRAVWERLLWRGAPGDRQLSQLAQALGFRPAQSADDAITFELNLVDA